MKKDLVVDWNIVWARTYERYNRHHKEIWDVMLPYAKGEILDLGCGPCVMYKGTDVSLTGVDASSEALSQAKSHYPTGNYVLADATKLPFLDSTFDTCFMLGLLDYFEDWDALIAEARRVTKGNIYATLLHGFEGHDWTNPPFPIIGRVGNWVIIKI